MGPKREESETSEARPLTESPERQSGSWLPLMIVLLSWAAIVSYSCWSYRAPEPPRGADVEEFHIHSALGILEDLVGDGIPHPAGSEQNIVVRERVASKLESFGYEVHRQQGTRPIPKWLANRTDLKSVNLTNLIAVRPGWTEAGNDKKAIAVVAHFDSHPAGPGASDDGVGVATLLEIARILSQGLAKNNPLITIERDVIFVITDGEEFGLLGAKLLAEESEWMDRIGLVINVEARGTTGPSLMFETSPMTRHLIPLFANSVQKPHCSSLFREVYKRLPRDSDFTVFRDLGKLGFNFAFIGDVKNYHTTADSLENVDLKSLYHHGENVIGLIRGIEKSKQVGRLMDQAPAAREVNSLSSEVVYFDFFGHGVFWWPANFSVWMCGVAFVLIGVVAVIRLRRDTRLGNEKAFGFSTLLSATCISVVTFVGVIAFGILLSLLVRLDGRLSNPWPAQPVLISFGYWMACLALVSGIAIMTRREKVEWSWIGACIVWVLFSIASSIFVVGASYLFLVPLLLAAMVAVLSCRTSITYTMVLAAIFAGLIWLPLERIFYDAVGFRLAPVLFFRIAILGTLLLPLIQQLHKGQRVGFALTMAVGSVGAFIAAIVGS